MSKVEACIFDGLGDFSLRKHPFPLALRRKGRFAFLRAKRPQGEERGETDVLAGYGDFRFLYLSTAKLSEIKNLEGCCCQNHDFL